MDEPLAQGTQQPATNPFAKAIAAAETDIDGPPAMRINIHRAINGYTVQVMKYKHNPHGPDWTGEMLVCKNGEEMMDTIKAGIAAARMDI